MTVALKGFETFTGTDTPVVGATVYAIVASDVHPNPGAAVSSTTTNTNGMWQFTALADATYDIRVVYNTRIKWRKGNEKFSNSLTSASFAAVGSDTVLAGPTSGAAAVPTFRNLDGTEFAPVAANLVLAGPVSGGSATPGFRSHVLADLPPYTTYPAFLVYNSTAQSIPFGATQPVVFDTKTGTGYDLLGEYNLTTDIWTVGRSGLYIIAFGHLWDTTVATGKRLIGLVSVNAVNRIFGYDFFTSIAGANWGWTGAMPLRLTAGDALVVGAFNGDTTARNILGGAVNCWFSAAWIPGT